MATLTGNTISSTYKDLLQVSNSNAGVDGTLRDVEDGEGTASKLQISTAGVKSTGTLDVTGNTTLAGTLALGGVEITSTAAELNIMDGGTTASSTTLADADRVVVNDGGTMKQVALTDFETFFELSIDTIANLEITTELQTPLIAFTDGDDAIGIADGGIVTLKAGGSVADGAFDFDIASHDGTNGLKLGGTLVTATAAELNIMDGVAATTAELNYSDGVTSAIQTQMDLKAPLASPTLTGTPAAPTAVAGTDTTQIATTAFVKTAVEGEDTLAELNDTTITSPADASLLLYDTGTATWRDGAMSGDATISDSGDLTLTAINTNLTTLANVTRVGTISSGTWEGTTIAVNQGGTGATALTEGGVLLGGGAGAITTTGVLTDGQILIGDGTSAPTLLDVGSSTEITVLGTVATGTWNGTAITNAYLANSAVTVGTTAISLGASSTTLAGLTSVTSTVFVGAVTGDVTGNADTSTTATLATTVTTNANLTGDVTSVGNATSIAAGVIVDADVKSDAAIAYSKLGTIPTWNQDTTGTAATVTGAAQAAITSVGTLSGLTVNGVVDLASSELTIAGSGGTVDHVLTTDGSGNITWAAADDGHSIKEESGSALTTRTNMTFIGELVEAVDNAVDDSTDILINAKTSWLYG